MVVQCEDCHLEYDDTYRLTYCPHAEFEMRTVVSKNGLTKVCTTLEELEEFLRDAD